jgi:hypothetical protein
VHLLSLADKDGDGLLDFKDNCPLEFNPSQLDTDADRVGDVCDVCPEDYNPSQRCCCGRVGDANGNGGDEPTISDVTVLIDALFLSRDWDRVPCPGEADANQSGGEDPTYGDISIGDISTLVDYLFVSGPTNVVLKQCPL